MSDFVKIAETIIGKKAIIEAVPAPPSEPKITYANVDKAHKLLDYHPQTSIAAGLNKFWAWYQTIINE
jgi:UDP-glucuronate 4-epimerase